MGEIKSTLDLVMEKTRNLKMSSEEKREQKAKESERRIKGLLQKLKDGLLTEDQLITEYENLKKTAALTDDSLLIEEIVTRLDPHHNTRNLMGILKKCCHQDTTAIQTIFDDYRYTFHQASRKRIKQIKEELAHEHSITGSAVVPNLDIDDDWQQEARDLRVQLENRLRKEMKLP